MVQAKLTDIRHSLAMSSPLSKAWCGDVWFIQVQVLLSLLFVLLLVLLLLLLYFGLVGWGVRIASKRKVIGKL